MFGFLIFERKKTALEVIKAFGNLRKASITNTHKLLETADGEEFVIFPFELKNLKEDFHDIHQKELFS